MTDKNPTNMKMYVLIIDDIPLGLAMVGAAHASLAAYLKFRDDPDVATWLKKSFRKVICKVTPEQFNVAKCCVDNVVITEASLGGKETAVAFKPRMDWPEEFRRFPLYS